MGEWNTIKVSTLPDEKNTGAIYEVIVNEDVVKEKVTTPVSYRVITVEATKEDYKSRIKFISFYKYNFLYINMYIFINIYNM